MSAIQTFLNKIKTAVFGRDVRSSIHDAINQCYKDATGHPDSVAAVIKEMDDTKAVVDYTIDAQNGVIAEIKDMSKTTLSKVEVEKARLDQLLGQTGSVTGSADYGDIKSKAIKFVNMNGDYNGHTINSWSITGHIESNNINAVLVIDTINVDITLDDNSGLFESPSILSENLPVGLRPLGTVKYYVESPFTTDEGFYIKIGVDGSIKLVEANSSIYPSTGRLTINNSYSGKIYIPYSLNINVPISNEATLIDAINDISIDVFGKKHTCPGDAVRSQVNMLRPKSDPIVDVGLYWEQGSVWNGTDLNDVDSISKRMRTNMFPTNCGDAIVFQDAAKGQLKFAVQTFADDSTFIKDTGWMSCVSPYVFDGTSPYARIVCAYIDDRDGISTLETGLCMFRAFGVFGQQTADIEALKEHHNRLCLPNMFAAAHRGHTDGVKHPENSMSAFKCAAELGYEFIETDLYITSDYHIALIHNDDITNKSMTLSELRASYPLSNGENVPILEDFLTFCKEYNITPLLDMKNLNTYDKINRLVNMLEKYDLADKVFIMSFDIVHVAIASGMNPNLNLVYLHDSHEQPDEFIISQLVRLAKTPSNRLYIGYWNTTTINENTYNYVRDHGLDGIYCMGIKKSEESLLKEITPYISGYATDDILPPISNRVTVTSRSAQPIEVASEAEMTAILENATANSVGEVYKYVGVTGTYESGALYIIDNNSTS